MNYLKNQYRNELHILVLSIALVTVVYSVISDVPVATVKIKEVYDIDAPPPGGYVNKPRSDETWKSSIVPDETVTQGK